MLANKKCKQTVWTGNRPQGLISHQCTRKAVEDGYCKVHHPKAVKLRADKAGQRLAATPFYMIHKY